MIEVIEVSRSFVTNKRTGEVVVALDGVNLDIKDHEFVSIIGPSGCGKTTLLRILAGLTHADGGEARLGQKAIEGPGPERAMVFQSFALLPWATVLENVAFGLKIQGVDRETREGVARDLINRVGLSGFEGRLPRELSGGMQQRVGLARALAVDPEVLLMDEPFGALDEQTKRIMQEELLSIWERDRKTAVFVTHSIDEAILLSDRVAVMSGRPGTIMEEVDIPLSRPRTREQEVTDEFLSLKVRLSESLRVA